MLQQLKEAVEIAEFKYKKSELCWVLTSRVATLQWLKIPLMCRG
jgi:hypothetical protein